MNSIKQFFLYIIIAGVLVSTTACSSFVEGLNVDPNNPTDVPVDLLLPSVAYGTGSLFGEDLMWYSTLMVQSQTGIARQMQAASSYTILSSDMNNAFNSAYAGQLNDIEVMIAKAAEINSPAYEGIAKILKAANLLVLSDIYGDIPSSEAFQGIDNLTPKYDDAQSEIYPEILALLERGIAAMGENSEVTPGSDDVIFGGDAASWIAAAHALKARYYVRLENWDEALSSAGSAMTSIAGDMNVPYGDAINQQNPLFQFNQQRTDLRVTDTFVASLDGDPRKPFFFAANASGNIVGSGLNAAMDTASLAGDAVAASTAAVPIISYAEVKFIEAEAYKENNNDAAARTALVEAVSASVEAVTGTPAEQTFLDAVIPATVTLEDIINQKHIAMFTQIESWTDWRRTGFPTLSPFPGQTNIPVRFPYPQNEIDLNANTPQLNNADGLYAPLFWDN